VCRQALFIVDIRFLVLRAFLPIISSAFSVCVSV
jgi:hypothetical protein